MSLAHLFSGNNFQLARTFCRRGRSCSLCRRPYLCRPDGFHHRRTLVPDRLDISFSSLNDSRRALWSPDAACDTNPALRREQQPLFGLPCVCLCRLLRILNPPFERLVLLVTRHRSHFVGTSHLLPFGGSSALWRLRHLINRRIGDVDERSEPIARPPRRSALLGCGGRSGFLWGPGNWCGSNWLRVVELQRLAACCSVCGRLDRDN